MVFLYEIFKGLFGLFQAFIQSLWILIILSLNILEKLFIS